MMDQAPFDTFRLPKLLAHVRDDTATLPVRLVDTSHAAARTRAL